MAAPVECFDEALAALAADLLDTMRAAPGIGITAPHIGVAQRVVVLKLERRGNGENLRQSGDRVGVGRQDQACRGQRVDAGRHRGDRAQHGR